MKLLDDAVPLLAVSLFGVLMACSPKSNESDGDATSSTGDGDSQTQTSASAPTTSESGTGSAGTTGTPDGTTGTGSTTGATTTGAGSTGEPGDGLADACQALCMRAEECMLQAPWEPCVESCVGAFGGEPECPAAAADYWSCLAALPCEALDVWIQEGSDACFKELVAVDKVCVECGTWGIGNEEQCTIGRECGDQTQAFVCEGDMCVCVENDVPGKMCQVPGSCALDFDAQAEAAQDCCGWDWP